MNALADQGPAEALHRLLELTECRCGYTLDMHATHCLAEYREDIETLVRAIPGGAS